MPEIGALTLTGLTDRLAKAEVYQSIQFAVNETLIATSTMRDAMPRILRTIGMALNWQLGMYWVKGDEDPPCLHMQASWMSPLMDVPTFIKLSQETTFCAGESLPGRVWASGTPVWFTDFQNHSFTRSKEAAACGIQTAIAFPVYSDLDIIGVIEFFSKNTDERPDQHLLDVLTNVGYRIGQFYKKRQLEMQLRDANARYRVLVDSAYSAVVVANEYGSIIEWNTAAEELFGWKKSEVLGSNLTTIIPERFRVAHLAGMQRIRENDHTQGSRVIGKITDLYGLHKEGKEFPIQLNLSTWNVTGQRYFGAIIRKGEDHA